MAGKRLRLAEENTLAIVEWRLAQWSPLDRWHPVLVRYTDYISRRLDGLGGNSSAIQPSPWGVYGPPGIPTVRLGEGGELRGAAWAYWQSDGVNL